MTNPALVSVVVPTLNAGRTLARCLASIREQTHPEVEIVVVDNGSSDDTWDIAERYADQVVEYGPERSAQRNHGWRISHGQIVVFIDADMVLEPRVAADAAEALAADSTLGGLVIPEAAFGTGFLADCRVLEKQVYLGNARAEAVRVFRRSALDELGGFAENLSAFEDWELTDRLYRAGYQVGRTRAVVWHDEGRIQLRRAFAKKRYYGQWLPAYRATGDPTARRRVTLPPLLTSPLLLAREPHHAAGLVVLKAVEWAGLVIGARSGQRAGRS